MSVIPEQLQEYALAEITRRIQTGEYPAGSRLVAKTIADSLDISSTPVVAAINRLEMQGLVETFPRRGAVVKKFSKDDIRNYFQARIMIECFAARLAVQNIDIMPDVVEEMRDAAENLANAAANHLVIDEVRTWESQFHSSLVKLSNNPQLERLYNFNWSVGSVYFSTTSRRLEQTTTLLH